MRAWQGASKQVALDADQLIRNADNINKSAWRVARIVRSLATYARGTYEEIEPHDLNEIIRETLLIIEHQMRTWSNINVTSRLAEDLPALHCERNSISQVLINLLTNAQEAMRSGGEITISTRYDVQNSRLVLQVTDNGPGIPEEIRTRIFDPFFTTKQVGDGTGLGLSIVHGIVHSHGGEIKVDSELNKGTTFSIYLPEEQPTSAHSGETAEKHGRYDN